MLLPERQELSEKTINDMLLTGNSFYSGRRIRQIQRYYGPGIIEILKDMKRNEP